MSKNWRDELDLLIENNLNELIRETREYDYAISKAKDKSKAQVWVAMAILNHKINELKLSKENYNNKIPKQEVDDIISKLEKL